MKKMAPLLDGTLRAGGLLDIVGDTVENRTVLVHELCEGRVVMSADGRLSLATKEAE